MAEALRYSAVWRGLRCVIALPSSQLEHVLQTDKKLHSWNLNVTATSHHNARGLAQKHGIGILDSFLVTQFGLQLVTREA